VRAFTPLLCFLVGVASPLTAQGAPQPPDTMALGVFHALIGQWEGKAWMMTQAGRQDVRQRETVRRAAGGTVISFEGLGTMPLPGGGDRVVHDAYGLVFLDHDGKTPRMRAFKADGNWLDMELSVSPTSYTWKMTDPRAGLIRYEMSMAPGPAWVEKGFMSRDEGKSWIQFFEMTLNRVR